MGRDSLIVWVTDDGTIVPGGDPEAMYPKEVDPADAEKLGLVEVGRGEPKKAAKPADKKRSTAKNKKG